MAKNISFTLHFWRQNGPREEGHFDTRQMKDIPDDTSFLEMLDILNEELINEGKEPFVFDHDCREGICGMCGAFDKIIAAGGYNTIRTGQAQDANAILIPKEDADEAMDAASCIGCGCCVAACKNGSAMLFVSSKVSQLALLPQGRPEAAKRAKAMVMKMEELGFGNCTNTRACEAECPKNESISNIARLNREFITAKFKD